MNYEHDQERLLSASANATQATVATAAQLWMARSKPLKVEVKTAAQDAQDASQLVGQGMSQSSIIQSIRQGESYQRIAKAGGDCQKYERLMLRKAEIDYATKIMPSQALAPTKTVKKEL